MATASFVTSGSSNCAISGKAVSRSCETTFDVQDYDLASTLNCGQAFRWEFKDGSWLGVIGHRWVSLRQDNHRIHVTTALPQDEWLWLEEYLQLRVSLDAIIATFPDDFAVREAVSEYRGLRLLRQPMWECLASFILSSSKQIVQIRKIIAELCVRHGTLLSVPPQENPAFSFPAPDQIAGLEERQLRDCRMGFRAPYLIAAATAVAKGTLHLEALPTLPIDVARAQLLQLAGVGPKIADCVLLFGCGFAQAFPVDVWVMKALRRYYFRNRQISLAQLRSFSSAYFGLHGGYAQQYLFHWLRRLEART